MWTLCGILSPGVTFATSNATEAARGICKKLLLAGPNYKDRRKFEFA